MYSMNMVLPVSERNQKFVDSLKNSHYITRDDSVTGGLGVQVIADSIAGIFAIGVYLCHTFGADWNNECLLENWKIKKV